MDYQKKSTSTKNLVYLAQIEYRDRHAPEQIYRDSVFIECTPGMSQPDALRYAIERAKRIQTERYCGFLLDLRLVGMATTPEQRQLDDGIDF